MTGKNCKNPSKDQSTPRDQNETRSKCRLWHLHSQGDEDPSPTQEVWDKGGMRQQTSLEAPDAREAGPSGQKHCNPQCQDLTENVTPREMLGSGEPGCHQIDKDNKLATKIGNAGEPTGCSRCTDVRFFAIQGWEDKTRDTLGWTHHGSLSVQCMTAQV